MTGAQMPRHAWAAWSVRAAIYAVFGAALYWWHPTLGFLASLFIAVDLVHHAADTARRGNGYVPIAGHPARQRTGKTILKARPRPVLLFFGLFLTIAAVTSRSLLDVNWGEAAVQALILAAMATAVGVVVFPVTAAALLWMGGLTVGLALSFGDLLSGFGAPQDRRKTWHRRIDQTDHQIAQALLAQPAPSPLRIRLAEQAADDAIGQKQ